MYLTVTEIEFRPNLQRQTLRYLSQAVQSDLIINEILFNPHPTGVDFVEVYNNSDKYITLKDWSLANYVNDEILNAKLISAEDILIAPREYLVFTENKSIIKSEYTFRRTRIEFLLSLICHPLMMTKER
jgi:hypothetical protein